MEIRSWNSYSCNNSSSFYLVASFESEALAGEVAKELQSFLAEHARQKDALDDDWETPSAAQEAMAEKYGFQFGDYLGWGDEALEGDEPSVAQSGQDLVLYHSYCGGFEDSLGPYLEARGAKKIDEQDDTPSVAAMFHFTSGSEAEAAREALETFFGQRAEQGEFDEFEHPFWEQQNRLPYGQVEEEVFFWTDGEIGGFHMPFDTGDLPALKDFLSSEAFADYRLLLCDASLTEKLRTLSLITNCPECKSSDIKLFEADSSMPEDQIACRKCNGMFSMSDIQRLQPVIRIGDGDQLMRVACAGETLYATSWQGAIWRRLGASEWEQVENNAVGLSGILPLSDTRALVCGAGGTMLATNDSGKSWKSIPTGVTSRLWNAIRTPSGTIFACGDAGTLLRSEDGKTFHVQSAPIKADLMHIAAASDEVLYMCTRNGKILRSKNGGASWTSQETGVKTPLCRILTLSENEAVVVGDGGTILTTKDGGTKWTKRSNKGKADIEDIMLGNDGRIYTIAGSGSLGVSDRRAIQWESIDTGATAHMWGLTATPEGTIIIVGAQGTVVQLANVDSASTAAPETQGPSRKTRGKSFAFTGKLSDMSRTEATARVTELGGISKSSVTKDLDYLVIGDEGSPLFGAGKKGSKMISAETLIAAGASLEIISETDFRKLEPN